jgi:hypothetical protein
MLSAGSGYPPGKYLAPLGDKTAQYIRFLVVYPELLDAKFAYLLLKIDLSTLSTTATVLTFPAIHLHIHTPILPGGTVFHIFFVRHKHYSYDVRRHRHTDKF